MFGPLCLILVFRSLQHTKRLSIVSINNVCVTVIIMAIISMSAYLSVLLIVTLRFLEI